MRRNNRRTGRNTERRIMRRKNKRIGKIIKWRIIRRKDRKEKTVGDGKKNMKKGEEKRDEECRKKHK
jgi:hypothetical protein